MKYCWLIFLLVNNYTYAGNGEPLHSLEKGATIYHDRCSLCHGKYGGGDGRMAKIITDPPPANLMLSRLSDDNLRKIIRNGGESVGRSPRMPAWKEEFSIEQINSVIIYIKSIRN